MNDGRDKSLQRIRKHFDRLCVTAAELRENLAEIETQISNCLAELEGLRLNISVESTEDEIS